MYAGGGFRRYDASALFSFCFWVGWGGRVPVCHSMYGNIASTNAVASVLLIGTEVKQSYASWADTVGRAGFVVRISLFMWGLKGKGTHYLEQQPPQQLKWYLFPHMAILLSFHSAVRRGGLEIRELGRGERG